MASELGITLVSFKDVVEEGKNLDAKFDEVKPETIYTLSYTSGTTGMPKGTMISHQNMVANVGAVGGMDGSFDFYEDDVYISYLPLAHVFERFFLICCMAYLMKYGFYQGDVMKLKEDLAELKPTIMISVPRLFNRFYDGMQAKINELTGIKRTITNWGI